MWYADDATGGGKLEQLRQWWDKLNECEPAFGYFQNAVKTWLIVKESQLALAKELFRDTGVQITTEGHRLLGASVGLGSSVRGMWKMLSPAGSNNLKLWHPLRTFNHMQLMLHSPMAFSESGLFWQERQRTPERSSSLWRTLFEASSSLC